MDSFETLDDAVRVAREVLAGTMDVNLGCGLIGSIAERNNHPSHLMLFVLLAHEQYDHEHLGMTAESLRPEIIEACRELLAGQT
jgi:hypothetical protein